MNAATGVDRRTVSGSSMKILNEGFKPAAVPRTVPASTEMKKPLMTLKKEKRIPSRNSFLADILNSVLIVEEKDGSIMLLEINHARNCQTAIMTRIERA